MDLLHQQGQRPRLNVQHEEADDSLQVSIPCSSKPCSRMLLIEMFAIVAECLLEWDRRRQFHLPPFQLLRLRRPALPQGELTLLEILQGQTSTLTDLI